ncbi:hypothetical protein HPB48_009213 [Haemaphysalis longicornis]|uniref:Tensin n=1 Tax=Haemaphysalis longicornis TaxID=44386 RepID=A0A9J6G8J0_HAELO|nr:hypothetical protein HPB48_009213 [Haemaphysalis longicornis]
MARPPGPKATRSCTQALPTSYAKRKEETKTNGTSKTSACPSTLPCQGKMSNWRPHPPPPRLSLASFVWWRFQFTASADTRMHHTQHDSGHVRSVVMCATQLAAALGPRRCLAPAPAAVGAPRRNPVFSRRRRQLGGSRSTSGLARREEYTSLTNVRSTSVFNLSEKRHDLARLNSQIVEFGWPAHLSPPLERLCTICKSLDSWFHADSQNVAILHSKGDKGRVGVVLAAYLHYTSICASDNQALDRLTMRRYYEDKLYPVMHPSQKRYVNYFTELLSGHIKMNNNPLYLHHLILHGIPNFDNRGGCRPFFKIYQGMQPVYTSGVHVATDGSRRLVVPLEAGQALRGDVLIKCYHKKQRPAGRTPIFRVQFHTCTLASGKVFFGKADLDDAVSDSRFPEDGQVELLFSQRPDDFTGNGLVGDATVTADQTKDPLVRQDSYENFDLIHEDSQSGVHNYGNPSPPQGLLHKVPNGGPPSAGTVEVEVHHSADAGGHLNHQPQQQGRSNLRSEHAELDDLLDGMLREIRSMPNRPTSPPVRNNPSSPHGTIYYSYSSRTTSSSEPPPPQRNGTDGSGTPYQRWPLHHQPDHQHPVSQDGHSPETGHRTTSPFSYGVEYGSPAMRRRRAHSESARDSFEERSYGTLRDASLSPEPVVGSSKPPIHRGLSAPTSPIIPSRTSSRDVTLRRYPQWQPQPLPASTQQPIVRQKSDTSFDRERPFVSAKRSHQQARDQMEAAGDHPEGTSPHRLISSSVVYGDPSDPLRRPGVLPSYASAPPPPRRDDILDMLNDPLFSTAPKVPGHQTGQPLFSEWAFLNRQHFLATEVYSCMQYAQDDSSLEGSSPWPMRGTDDSPSASPSSATDRPATPAFPVPPRTPYMNQDSSGGLPPKSPTLSRRRSPSPATLSALQQSLPPSSVLPTSPNGQSSPTVYFGQSRRSSMLSLADSPEVIHHHPVFVKDTSKYWYKPNISREEAIHVLKTKPPGTFIVRDSNSFPGAFGLALKVASPPPNVQNRSEIGGEPFWTGDVVDSTTAPTTAATASSLMQQGAACNVLYLCTMDMESLTGPQAVRRAMAELLAISPPPVPTVVHFKVSSQGITLTDSNRKLFFRRHYALNAISFCGTDPEDRRWTQKDEDAGITVTARCFGFVARKPASKTDNQCHLFAELDPEQPASAIVNFVGKVMDSAGISATRANMI